jgi:hypothetical protein
MEQLMEKGEVSRLVERSTQTVDAWAEKGLLPIAAVTGRGLKLFKRADVEAFLAAREAPRAPWHRRLKTKRLLAAVEASADLKSECRLPDEARSTD